MCFGVGSKAPEPAPPPPPAPIPIEPAETVKVQGQDRIKNLRYGLASTIKTKGLTGSGVDLTSGAGKTKLGA